MYLRKNVNYLTGLKPQKNTNPNIRRYFHISERSVISLLIAVKKISGKIRKDFGLKIICKTNFKRGKLTETSSLKTDTGTCISELDQENA